MTTTRSGSRCLSSNRSKTGGGREAPGVRKDLRHPPQGKPIVGSRSAAGAKCRQEGRGLQLSFLPLLTRSKHLVSACVARSITALGGGPVGSRLSPPALHRACRRLEPETNDALNRLWSEHIRVFVTFREPEAQ